MRAFDELLPAGIDRAEIEGPTLLIVGSSWSLSATCAWRWVKGDGSVIGPSTVGADDLIWDLVGDEIVAMQWTGPPGLGIDPWFTLRSGGVLDLFSDAAFDTWVLHTPELVVVGPLRVPPERRSTSPLNPMAGPRPSMTNIFSSSSKSYEISSQMIRVAGSMARDRSPTLSGPWEPSARP